MSQRRTSSGTASARPRRRGSAQRDRPRVEKISITVDAKVIEDVKRVARQGRRTLSAEISEALARDLRTRRLREIIEDFETAHGPITETELATVRAQWG